MNDWERETDVLVFGSGASGMTAALVAKQEGLDVLLCEKTHHIGGTTAVSGGTIWIPGNAHAKRAGIADSIEAARRYLDGEIGADRRGLREAFLQSGAEAIDYLERHTALKFRVPNPYPDYHLKTPGAADAGRALQPIAFDARALGSDFALLREPRPGFTVLGGMMVNRDEAALLLRPWRSWRALAFTARTLLRHARDRARYPRGARLLIGNALAGRFFMSLKSSGVPYVLEARLDDLLIEDGRVQGATVTVDGRAMRIKARAGVVLATGGFAGSDAWRRRLMADTPSSAILAAPGATGDGIGAALRAGGRLEADPAGAAFWMPASILKRPGLPDIAFPHVIMDRARPGLVAVNRAGKRFVNEADSYHDFVVAMFRADAASPSIPAYLICDRSFVWRYGIGLVRPIWQRIGKYVRAGYMIEADSIEDLAHRTGIDARGLLATVAEHNRDALRGIDSAFGKGGNTLNLMYGDPEAKPNPCMRPIERPPFFAVPVYPAVLGTSAGLATDADARVLDAAGAPIEGLYACGNDQSSIMQGHYPGAGITLGPAIVFGYRASRHLSRSRNIAHMMPTATG